MKKFSPIFRDFLSGLTVVLITSASILVFKSGKEISPETYGCGFWAIASSILVSALLKGLLTGERLKISEALRTAIFIGLLALSASPFEIWQSPAWWRLSAFGAAVFTFLYHLANAYYLSQSKKHLDTIGGGIITAIPFAFGLLLSLQHAGFWKNILYLFLFNALLANAFHLTQLKNFIKELKAYGLLFIFSLLAILSPYVANWGSENHNFLLNPFIAIFTTMISQGFLWAVVFMATGMLIDGMRGQAPNAESIRKNAMEGIIKGGIYSGILMTILQCLNGTFSCSYNQQLYQLFPMLILAIFGALIFPLCKTIIESFDGSQSFLARAQKCYSNKTLYARGMVAGFAFAMALKIDFTNLTTAHRILYGFIAGAIVFAGISLGRDFLLGLKQRGRVKTWRLYLAEAGLGGFIGGGLGFYLDATQVPVILEKLKLYNSFGQAPVSDDFYPLISKWGHIQLGSYTGGSRLLLNEALKGVIGWGVAAWLFAINKSMLTALFERNTKPIKRIFSREGLSELTDNTIYVLRWGLWMAPIIFTFLRQMAEPSWYNQDGAIRSVFAIFNQAAMTPENFNQWSLNVFMMMLAYDFLRVLIWIDHMGLRVATLVNLSFLGMDRLDERIARFIGPAVNARFIPEGVKRFTTWAPLLIPFYLPRGKEWDWVWTESEKIQQAATTSVSWIIWIPLLLINGTLFFYIRRLLSKRSEQRREKTWCLGNSDYTVELKKSGELNSFLTHKDYDLTRRAYDRIDPAGRSLFVVDEGIHPVLGNFPSFSDANVRQKASGIILESKTPNLHFEIKISLPDPNATVECWEIKLKNTSNSTRNIKMAPYLEWVLNSPEKDRGHTQYNRLYPEMHYVHELNAVLAQHRMTKIYGLLASDQAPEGFLTSRMDFIGRAGDAWQPRALESFNFDETQNTDPYPTFDPIATLLLSIQLEAGAIRTIRFLVGCASSEEQAKKWIGEMLKPEPPSTSSPYVPRKPLIGHGEAPQNTPYFEYRDHGNTLRILTPFTPRPFDHTMSNSKGHVLCVTNRGLHTSANADAQRNRLTTDWADTVTSTLPSEIFYIFDPEQKQWYSPTYLPLKDHKASYTVDFSVDGTATFRMQSEKFATELTTFVPENDPVGLYRLRLENQGEKPRKLRVASFFRLVLTDQPENADGLKVKYDNAKQIIFAENSSNAARPGTAFVAQSFPVEKAEIQRGKFMGTGRNIEHPFMLEQAETAEENYDNAPVAVLYSMLEIPAGESHVLTIALGQGNHRKQALKLAQK